MVFSRRGALRRNEARHRWDALFPSDPGHDEAGLLDLAVDTAPLPLVEEDPADRSRAHGPRLAVSLRLGAVVAVLLALACGGWWWVSASAQPEVRPVAAAGEDDGGGSPAAVGRTEGDATSGTGHATPGSAGGGGDGPTVHVVGAVAAPGVYRLPPGARVHEAIAAAGGAVPGADTDRLNLAAPVEDGTRLRVPLVGEPEEVSGGNASSGGTSASGGTAAGAPAAGASVGASAGSGRKVNINTATVAELAGLPRVGPVLAQRIVDFRTAHGRFTEPEGLDAVSGIGPKMLESLLPLVTVR